MDKYLLISAISIFVRCSISLLLKSCISRLIVNITRDAVPRVVRLEEYDTSGAQDNQILIDCRLTCAVLKQLLYPLTR